MILSLPARIRARLFGHRGDTSADLTGATDPPRSPDPICLIGDIHGRLDLLDDMIARIRRQDGGDHVHIITLGDMIDRGPDSAGVIARLMAEDAARPGGWTCLMGNHERMLLDFLADPADGRRWLTYGGAETLRSYGVTVAPDRPAAMAAALRDAMPPAHLDWIAARPLFWQGNGIAAVHAAADPMRPIDRQTAGTLLWGHADFGRIPRRDGLWIAFGHVIQSAPWARDGQIAVDTGAWQSDVLCAAWIDRNGLRFLQTGSQD